MLISAAGREVCDSERTAMRTSSTKPVQQPQWQPPDDPVVIKSRLFLASSSLLLLSLRPLLPLADQARLTPRLTQLPVRRLLAREVADLALLHGDLVVDGEELVGPVDVAVVADLLGRLHLLDGGLALLDRLGLAGEDDEAGAVGLEALHVGFEGFFGEVLAAGVDGDADGGCQLAGDAGFLQPY